MWASDISDLAWLLSLQFDYSKEQVPNNVKNGQNATMVDGKHFTWIILYGIINYINQKILKILTVFELRIGPLEMIQAAKTMTNKELLGNLFWD